MARAGSPGDRELRLLVGAVVTVAATILGTAVAVLVHDRQPVSLTLVVALASLVAAGSVAVLWVRIRATPQGFSWTETAALIGLAIAPGALVVVCVAVGVTGARLFSRRSPMKTAFSIGKDTIAAGAAALAAASAGLRPPDQPDLTHVAPIAELLPGLFAALIAFVLVDDMVTLPVIAIASETRFRALFRTNWDVRVAGVIGRLIVAVVALAVIDHDPRLLVAVPPIVISLHLAYSTRLRTRAERLAWQQLAATTDRLNVVDLDVVLRSAVTRGAELFSADQAEVELHHVDPHSLVRGTAEQVIFSGLAADAPFAEGVDISTPLQGHNGSADIGVLRLRFRGPVKLSEREQYTLSTFASALCTAIRNASAYAELERAAGEHEHAATHDALTGLANRRQLLDRGSELIGRRHAEGVTALLLIDLNHFKEINDTLGHTAGDRLLVEVARRFRGAAQPQDLVARLGGDEFAVLLSALPAPAVAAYRAERMLGALHEPLELDGMRISVEASGGIAVATGTGGIPELLRRADVAMYQAKRSGQRIATYARDRDTADVSRLALGGDLPRAVAEHEFIVNFQPIVDLGTGEVVAAEALARWRHPDRGNIDPMRFLETVERSGLLPAFAEAVLDQSLIAASTWREAGFDLPVAVNVSPRSLLDSRFPRSVVARLRAHDLPPDRLVLELTETLTISQLEVVDQVLGQLRDEGIRLALDDFGTGYSSLSVLSRIPVHELKIDRAFVMAMETSAEAAAVIRSTLDLGRSLDLVVVAEGVESESQRRTLWELGCSAGQGHLFGRPMPAARLLATLHRGSGGRPGTLAPPLYDEGAVIRLSLNRRAAGRSRGERLPHFPA